MSMTAWRGRSGPPVARFLLSASRAVIDPVKLIGQLRTEINGGEPIRMFSLQHLGIKTIWAARLINGDFREISSEERRVGKESVSKCRSRWSRYHKTKNQRRTIKYNS